MGARGPRKKPAAEKELTGNPGGRPIQPARAIKAPAGMPECPDHLSAEARAEWRRVTAELQLIGLLTKVDRGALAGYCQAWARHVRAEQQREEYGDWIGDDSGRWKIAPWVSVSQQAARIMLMFLKEFGLSPASRGRIDIEPVEEEDEFDQLLKHPPATPPPPPVAAAKPTRKRAVKKKPKPKPAPKKTPAPKKRATKKRGSSSRNS